MELLSKMTSEKRRIRPRKVSVTHCELRFVLRKAPSPSNVKAK